MKLDNIAQIPADEVQLFDFAQSFNGILPSLFLEVVTMDREDFLQAYKNVHGEDSNPEEWMTPGHNEFFWIQNPNGGGDYGEGETLREALSYANDTLLSCEYTIEEFPGGTLYEQCKLDEQSETKP